ncbi:ROK family protein [Humidisolicoccus flavus]|uniref:ROK family protein n=1 Tax=Humidisolicoccus flavus TaxID=3111414 RepID=UPI00324C0ADD
MLQRDPLPGMTATTITRSPRTFVGIDIGGTKVAAVLTDGHGTVLHQYWFTHSISGQDALLDEVERAYLECVRAADQLSLASPHSVGVGIAAWFAPGQSRINYAAHFKIRDFELAAPLRERLGVPITIDNDGNAQALGEFTFGSGRDAESLLLLSFGTGVGGGLIVNGAPLHGAHGYAGELGHVTVDEDGPVCSCDAKGCLESFAGGQALARVGNRLSAPRALAAAEARQVTAKDLVDAARAGDVESTIALDDAARAIAAALRRLLPAFDPAVVTIGGSLGIHAAPWWMPVIERELAAMAPLQAVPQPRHISVSSLGTLTTAIGAAALAILRARVDDAKGAATSTSTSESTSGAA